MKRFAFALAGIALAAVSAAAAAQWKPSRPVTIIVPWSAGGSTDQVTRGAQASLWHVIHNGLTKGVLFLAVANIHRAYGTKSTEDIRGVLRRLPVSGAMLLAGFFAITGSPPFAPFVSEFQMISASFAGGHYVAGSIFIGCMLLVFFGMGASVAAICLGEPNISAERRIGSQDHLSTSLPMLAALVLVVLLGVYNPPEIQALVQAATDALFGQS